MIETQIENPYAKDFRFETNNYPVAVGTIRSIVKNGGDPESQVIEIEKVLKALDDSIRS